MVVSASSIVFNWVVKFQYHFIKYRYIIYMYTLSLVLQNLYWLWLNICCERYYRTLSWQPCTHATGKGKSFPKLSHSLIPVTSTNWLIVFMLFMWVLKHWNNWNCPLKHWHWNTAHYWKVVMTCISFFRTFWKWTNLNLIDLQVLMQMRVIEVDSSKYKYWIVSTQYIEVQW